MSSYKDYQEIEMNVEDGQKIAIEILKKVEAICNKLDIKYWVMYGSLIGAIRHKGFIPWDDDLDIAMSRWDYNKLLEYFSNSLTEKYGLVLDNPTVSNSCPFYISRICDNTYRLEFDYTTHTSGMFIDVYPFDGMGNKTNNLKLNIINRKKRYYINMLILSSWRGKFNDSPIIKIAKTFFEKRAKKKGNYYYFQKMETLSRTFEWDQSLFVGCLWESSKRLYKRDWFENIIYLPFENVTVPVPANYKEVLNLIYGDYMQLPPEEKRKPQHGYTIKQRIDDRL